MTEAGITRHHLETDMDLACLLSGEPALVNDLCHDTCMTRAEVLRAVRRLRDRFNLPIRRSLRKYAQDYIHLAWRPIDFERACRNHVYIQEKTRK